VLAIISSELEEIETQFGDAAAQVYCGTRRSYR
jgi:hypothetical protein